MTARTHDLFAFTALTLTIIFVPLPQMNLPTAGAAFGMLFLGGLTPDLDEPASALWQRMPAGSGSVIGRILRPVFGGHRFITHSILGIWIIGKILWSILMWLSPIVLVDMNIVWWAFIIGMISHVFSDAITREGVPLFFPLPFKVGIPPIAKLRMKTGGFVEKAIVFPGLVAANAYLFYRFKDIFWGFIKGLV